MADVITTFEEGRSRSRAVARSRRGDGGSVGLVPTMGYLHEGHLSLIEAAASRDDAVLVSIFVNPLQFGPGEDLERYPRDLERDVALASEAGADLVFAPSVEEMYPVEPLTRVIVRRLDAHLCGPARPDHFEGVATVVAKLFAGLAPDRAYFGRKDAQQLALVTRMAKDLSFPIEVVGRPIVREPDGLALSSRNVYLSEAERQAATALSRGLMAAADLAEAGERSGAVLVARVRDEFAEEPLVEPEYVELVDLEEVQPLGSLDRSGFLAVAARVGPARLIDNVHLFVEGDGIRADRGVRLAAPSVLWERRRA